MVLLVTHQGFIVNMDYIKCFDATDVVLFDGTKVMISVRKSADAVQAFDKYKKNKNKITILISKNLLILNILQQHYLISIIGSILLFLNPILSFIFFILRVTKKFKEKHFCSYILQF